MPLELTRDGPTMLIRKTAYERSGLSRRELDLELNLTSEEFQTEGDLVAIGPLYAPDAIGSLTARLEGLGLVYFDDFFEMSGGWPAWLRVYIRA
ncbi:MAG TPA: hypothetical protein VEI06_01260 [Gemmatimonadaceae bacterium]|nr:hypothetical protein [Gemmatimonadaceae bacterium]